MPGCCVILRTRTRVLLGVWFWSLPIFGEAPPQRSTNPRVPPHHHHHHHPTLIPLIQQASAGTSQAYTRASTFSGYQFPAPRGDTIEASPSSLSGGEDGGEEGGALHLEPETGAPRTTDPRSVELQTDLRTRPAGGGVSQPALQDWLDQMMPRERTTADARRGRTPPRHAAPPPRQQRDASPPPPRHDRPHRGDSQDPGQAQARPGAARPGAPAGATRGASPGRRLAGVRSPGGGASHGGGAGGRRSASPPSVPLSLQPAALQRPKQRSGVSRQQSVTC